MERRKFLVAAVASAAAMLTGAAAQSGWDHDHHGPGPGPGHGPGPGPDPWHGRDAWHWRDDHGGWHADHDRYWRPEYQGRRYIDRDRVFWQLRRHHYYRWIGDPYWFHGRYVIRTYNRWGRVVFVEIDPYSGDFVGEVVF